MSLRPASTSFIRTGTSSGNCQPMVFHHFPLLNCQKPQGNPSFSDLHTYTITFHCLTLSYLTLNALHCITLNYMTGITIIYPQIPLYKAINNHWSVITIIDDYIIISPQINTNTTKINHHWSVITIIDRWLSTIIRWHASIIVQYPTI